MSNEGKVQLTGVVVAPPELVGEGERLWRSHAKWMEATHHRSGEKELLAYNVAQTPELDEAERATGKVVFVLTEIYESQAGVDDHMQQADDSWDEWQNFQQWMGGCEVRVSIGPITHSLW